MSNGMNRVTLFGRLGSDPEFRVTQAGMGLLRMRVATNEAYYDRENKLVERTDWHDVVLFGNRAEGLSRILAKGEPVFVYGSIRYSTYEKDGVTRTKAEVHARDIGLAGRPSRRTSPGLGSSSPTEDTVEQPYGESSPSSVAEPAATFAGDAVAEAPIVPVEADSTPPEFPRKRKRVDTGASMNVGA